MTKVLSEMNHLTSLCLLLMSLTTGLAADHWLQWRGPTRDGQLELGSPWPNSLSAPVLEQVWRVPLGPSYSGPIVCGERVLVTETRDETTEVVRALDRWSGEELWRAEWPGSLTVPFFARENGSWIRSTPACDGESLFVAGIRDVLVRLDVKTGEEIWRVDLVAEFDTALPGFGTVCSPLLDEEFVYLQAAASTVKLRKRDGSVVWRSVPESGGLFGQGMGASAFSSPVIATLAGQRQLVAQSRERLIGMDLDSGRELWSVDVPAFRGMNILTPLIVGDSVFTSSYGGGTFLFDIERSGDEFQVVERWQNKQQGYMSSPLLIGGFVYLHLRNQRFTCIDPASGETMWTSKPYGKYVSMVANGSQILALDQRGELRLLQADSSEYRELDAREVSEESTWAHVAVADDQVLVRELGAVAAWRWQDQLDTTPATGTAE